MNLIVYLDNVKSYKRIILLYVGSSAQPTVVNPMKTNANNKKTNLELQQIYQVNRVVDVSQTPAQTELYSEYVVNN